MPDQTTKAAGYLSQHWPWLSAALGSIGASVGYMVKQKQKLDQVHNSIPTSVHKGDAVLQTNEDMSDCHKQLVERIEKSHDEQKDAIAEVHSRVDEVHGRVDQIYNLLVNKL